MTAQSSFAAHSSRRMRPRGFALLIVIALIAIMAMAMVALGMVLTRQAKRTSGLREQAQLRQLLLAGAADVCQKSRAWPDAAKAQQWTVSLPKDLAGDGATLAVQVKPAGADAALATIDATLAQRRMRQTITLIRQEKLWRISECRLGE